MALRLRVVSDHASRLGQQATKVFGVHGGTIGRGTDNDWILPDPDRYLSGKHARIDFRAGAYVLVDTSSNGTYVNGAQVPLGKYHDYLLKDGDYIRFGEYELMVSIDKSNDFPPEQSAIVAYDGEPNSSAVKKSTANDLGADLDLSELLEPSDQLAVDSGFRAHNAYGQSIPPVGDPAAAAESEDSPGGTPWHMLTRPLKVESSAAVEPRAAGGTFFDTDIDLGLASFCRGAGIDPKSVTPEARGAALQLAGQLLREAVLGLMDLNQNRNEFRNRFRIAPLPPEVPESPLSFSRGVDEALVRLLTTISTRAGSVEAIRSNFRELKAQNVGLVTAMRAAFEEFLSRVDPKELEERFERATKRGVFGAQNKGRYWDLYTELFSGLVQRPPDGFPHLFIEAFAKAYEAKVRVLVPPRRSGIGADRAEPDEPPTEAIGDF
jgi:type VI secretion system FHA domain protein